MKSRLSHLRSTASRSVVTACAIAIPSIGAACTVCNTEAGKQVRATIFGEEFWSTLLLVVSPFPVLLLAIAAYHLDWPPFGPRSTPETQLNSPTS